MIMMKIKDKSGTIHHASNEQFFQFIWGDINEKNDTRRSYGSEENLSFNKTIITSKQPKTTS